MHCLVAIVLWIFIRGASKANLNNTCSNHIQNSCYICLQRKITFQFSFILYYYCLFFTLCHIIVSFSLFVFSLYYTKCFADALEILFLSKHIAEKLAFKVHAIALSCRLLRNRKCVKNFWKWVENQTFYLCS